ncbi:MAG: S8 family peptidase, partial [Chthoniobacterales bacterium]
TQWGQQWGPLRIGMVDAWDVPQAVTSLRVAIVDTGVDRMHSDLSNSIVYGRSFNTNSDGTFRYGEIAAGDALRTNLVAAGASPGTPAADRNHGTHVAGIAAAIRDNSTGIAGIVRAGIMAMGCGSVVVDVNTNVSPPVTNSKTLISWTADAINDAVANGAHVINCSFSSSSSDGARNAAVTAAQNAGVVVVAAAGNNATNISDPASQSSGWLSHAWPVLVGSVEGYVVNGVTLLKRSTFSNFGPELDIASPGTGIYSTLVGSGFGFQDGTSMAAPHVTGAVAFTRSMNPDRIRGAGTMDLLYRMVEDVGAAGPDSDFGRGLLRLRPEYLRVLKNATTFAGQGAWLLFFGQSVGGPGTYENPYPSLSEALSNTPSGGTVVLNAGATNAAGVPANTTLTNAATLTAFPDRPVTFGAP